MPTTTQAQAANLFADKGSLNKIIEEQYRQLGIEYDPNATAAQARELALEEGIRPEENIMSRGIIEAREEE